MKPLISIIIPTYNRKEMLKNSIDSIFSQNYINYEIIVIDDNSNDGTREMIFELYPNIIYSRNKKNMGPSYNRKLGMKMSKGDYLIFMDDDDYYTDPLFFTNAINILENNKENNISFLAANSIDFIQENNRYIKNNLHMKGIVDGKEYLQKIGVSMDKPRSTFTTLFNRHKLEESGLMNIDMVNDFVIYMRSLLQGDAYILEDTIGVYRIHGNNISNRIKADFILENLKEKKKIYDLIISKRLFEEYDKWWQNQILITVGYYVYESIPSIKELYRVNRWCKMNSNNNIDIKLIFHKYFYFLLDKKKCKYISKLKELLHM